MTDPNPAYVPKIGDTVRWGSSTSTYAVRVPDEGNGETVVACDVDGKFFVFATEDLVKVEPTPADRYVVFDEEGEPVTNQSFRLLPNACNLAGKAYRVARFTFAEWIDK